MSLYDDALALHDRTEYVLYLSHRGAVQRTLQPSLVNVPAAHLAECLRVEQALPPRFKRQVDQGGLPRTRRYPEVPGNLSPVSGLAVTACGVEAPVRTTRAPRREVGEAATAARRAAPSPAAPAVVL